MLKSIKGGVKKVKALIQEYSKKLSKCTYEKQEDTYTEQASQ